MDVILVTIFVFALFIFGVTYSKFCKETAEDLVNTIKFRNIEEEGGDNWPSMQLELGDFDTSDNFTYADFEKSCTQIRLKEKEFCKQK